MQLLVCGLFSLVGSPGSILYKSIAGRYWPVSYPDGPITARYRFIKNAYWVLPLRSLQTQLLSALWPFLSIPIFSFLLRCVCVACGRKTYPHILTFNVLFSILRVLWPVCDIHILKLIIAWYAWIYITTWLIIIKIYSYQKKKNK